MISLMEIKQGWEIVILIGIFIVTMFYGQRLFFGKVYFLKEIFQNKKGETFFILENIIAKENKILNVNGYEISDDVIVGFDVILRGNKIYPKKSWIFV